MIKYYTTTNTTDAQLNKIKTLCSGTCRGIVISQDNRKIYFQPTDNTPGWSVGQAEYLIKTTDCPDSGETLGRKLYGGKKYLQNSSSHLLFNVHVTNFGVKVGDTIELYLQYGGHLIVKNSANIQLLNKQVAVADGNLVLVKIVCINVDSEGNASWSAKLAGGGSALAFDTDTWEKVSANFTDNKDSGLPVATSALYNGVSGLLTNSEHAFWNGTPFYFNGSIISGSKSIVPSTLPYAKYESATTPTTASAGVVTLLNVDTGLDSGYPNGILTGRLGSWEQPLNAITTVKYVHGQEYLVLSTIFNEVQYTEPRSMKQGAAASLVRTNILPSAAPDGTYGIVTTNSGYTSSAISASPDVWVASAAYKYISGVIDGLDLNDEDALTAVTFNGTKHPADNQNRIANIGTVSTAINGHTHAADGDNYIDLGNSFVEITQGSMTAGYYVQRTSTGYKLDPGIATLSSTYTATGDYSSITVDGNAIPVMLYNVGQERFFPIEKGSLTAGTGTNAGKFIIDLRPYYAYIGFNPSDSGGDNCKWIVYYGAGINDIYTKANTITKATVNSANYNVQFLNGDVHVLTFTGTGTTQLMIPDLAEGHGMIIKIINNGPRTIKFGSTNRTLVDSAGTYTVSFFNFGSGNGGIQQIGEVTNVY